MSAQWVGHRKRREADHARRHRLTTQAALAAAARGDWNEAARLGIVLT